MVTQWRGGVAERFALNGPFELTLALRRTEGGVLGDFGAGWQQPSDWDY